MDIQCVKWQPGQTDGRLQAFLKRDAVSVEADETARRVLDDIRNRGDAALLEYTRQFEGIELTSGNLLVGKAEIKAAAGHVDPEFKRAAQQTMERVETFAKAGMRSDWEIATPFKGRLGEVFHPLERVGVYVPGGAAPLVSTVLMTVPIARVAGVKDICASTPAQNNGTVNPYILYTLDLCGVSEICRLGGIQSIGAMAYGTETIRKVQKIVGPGGPYVTAAKRLVYGDVGLDMVAGPSEIAILADETADPGYVAADLLSQAEHGSGMEKCLFVTTSRKLAEKVVVELHNQCETLSRRDAVEKVLQEGTLLVIVDSVEEGITLCNIFAPEHMELIVERPHKYLKAVNSAGALFIGPWTPECTGDFVAGPSHVLPTGGTAKVFSGLTVDDFRRRMSVIEFTRDDLAATWPVIEAFGRVESLDAHARSARIRFEPLGK